MLSVGQAAARFKVTISKHLPYMDWEDFKLVPSVWPHGDESFDCDFHCSWIGLVESVFHFAQRVHSKEHV